MSKRPTNIFSYVNAANGKNPKISINGYIGPWESIDFNSFQKAFEEIIKDASILDMEINCGGGSCFDGLAMYDLVRSANIHVNTYVVGMAASMGSILALAGDKRYIAKNGRFMTHKVQGGYRGEADGMRQYAGDMDNLEVQLVDIYKERTGQKDNVINGWMKPNTYTWHNATQCLANGLVNEIIPYKDTTTNRIEIPEFENKADKEVWHFFQNIIPLSTNQSITENQMDKKLLVATLGLKNINAEMSDADMIAALKGHIDDQNTKITELETQAKTDEDLLTKANNALKNVHSSEVKTFLDVAQNDLKKITAEQRKEYEKLSETTEGFAVVKNLINKMSARTKITEQITNKGNKGGEEQPDDETNPKPEDLNGMLQARMNKIREKNK